MLSAFPSLSSRATSEARSRGICGSLAAFYYSIQSSCILRFSQFRRIVPQPVTQYPLPSLFFRIIGLGKITSQILQSKWLTRNLKIRVDLCQQMERKTACCRPICGGKYQMLTMRQCHRVPPSPLSLQNIEKKEAEKIGPRKILHPKELDITIAYPKDLRPQIRSQWPEGRPGARNLRQNAINQVGNNFALSQPLIPGH